MNEYWSVTFIPVTGQPPRSASSVLYVHIILGIIKKVFGHQEADPGGLPDTGIKVTLQYSFRYV